MAAGAPLGLFLNRQPVFSRDGQVVGYELMRRPYLPSEPRAEVSDAQAITTLLDFLSRHNLSRLVGETRAYIPLTRSLIACLPSALLPPPQTTLLIGPGLNLEEPYLQRLEALAGSGYTLALDGAQAIGAWVGRLAPVVQVYRLPLHRQDPMRLMELLGKLRLTRAKMIANWIETPEEANYAQRLGFDFFQGNYYTQPRPAPGRRVDTSRMAVMRTLAAIQDPTADFRSLARMIAQDALLSTKLLTMVNSPTFGLPRAIDSLEQAVAYAGLNALRSWMSLLTLASIPGKPPELTQLAILRAKMNESIAASLGLRPFDQHFSVGLFSVLDALLDLPIHQAIQNIPLAKETVEALVAHSGAAGQVLQATLLWEHGEWDLLLQSSLNPHSLLNAYTSSVQAALDFAQSLKK